MPLMNGIDATAEIRKKNQKVPIIALTAYVSDTDKQTALAAGCNDFLTKPVRKEVLWEKISGVFAGSL
ncbi:response regulator [Maribellus comscasis]|nr:response regulator [Maribellus comscasis]